MMHAGMARYAKRDQVFFRIIAGLAAEFFVVNLKIRPAPCAVPLAERHRQASGGKPSLYAWACSRRLRVGNASMDLPDFCSARRIS